MRRIALFLPLLLLLSVQPASAATLATCEGSAELEWTGCEGQADAEWRRLAVRYCFGEGDLGFFTGQLKVKVTAEHGGYSQIGDGEPLLLVAAQGCLEDWVGGNTLDRGTITWSIEARGVGFYSVSVRIFRQCCPS
jgi:hypothetical protein